MTEESIWEPGTRIRLVTDRWDNLAWTEEGRVYEVTGGLKNTAEIRKVSKRADRLLKSRRTTATTLRLASWDEDGYFYPSGGYGEPDDPFRVFEPVDE